MNKLRGRFVNGDDYEGVVPRLSEDPEETVGWTITIRATSELWPTPI